MKKIVMLLYFCFLYLLPNAIPIHAKTTDLPRVHDYADILTANEEKLLEPILRATSDKNNADVIVYTIESTNGSDLADYAKEIAKASFAQDVVIIVINMDSAHREVLIRGFGTGETYVSSKRCQHITDNMVDDLKAKNYYDALLYFNEKVNYFYEHKNPVATPQQILIEVVVALVLALIVVLCMVLGAGGKNTTTCDTYLDARNSKILAKRDIYTHTTTTRHKIESNNSNSGDKSSGGGSCGRSSF